MLTDFQNSFTIRLSRKFAAVAIRRWLKISPHLKRVATLPCETFMLKIDLISKWSDYYWGNYKLLFFLGGGSSMLQILNYMVYTLHLLQLTTFWLINTTVNIQNVFFWLECRHGYICTTSHAMTSWITLCSTPSHTSIRRCLKYSHPTLLSDRHVAQLCPRCS